MLLKSRVSAIIAPAEGKGNNGRMILTAVLRRFVLLLTVGDSHFL